MDGKSPEATGIPQPVESRSPERDPVASPCTREESESNQSESRPFEPQNGDEFRKSSIPVLNWQLFKDLSIPDENVVYSLHDGRGVCLEVAGDPDSIWDCSQTQLVGKTVFERALERPAFKGWFLSLETEANAHPFILTLNSGSEAAPSLQLKRIPLFISIDPSESRIILKAARNSSLTASIESPRRSRDLTANYLSSGQFVSSSPCWNTLLGYTESEIAAIPLFELAHPNFRNSFEALINSDSNSIQDSKQVATFICKDGSQRSLYLHIQRSGDAIQINAKDLTLDKTHFESALTQLSATAFATLNANSGKFGIESPNLAFESATGYSPTGANPIYIEDLFGERSDDDRVSKIKASIESLRFHSEELVLYKKNGDHFWGSISIIPLHDHEGRSHRVVLAIEDVTDEKEAQKIAMQQENLRSLGQMASGIAHDFNNLLAPILGFSELLLNMPEGGRDDQKLVHFLEKIKVAAQDGAAVVSRLREFYTAQDPNLELLSDFDPSTLVEHVKDLTQHRWKSQAEARGADISFQSKIRTKRLIHGNEPEIRQAISNLVINAADAIDSNGSICLKIDDQNENVRIQIIDTGKGMPESIRSKCLDPFYTTKGKLGTGLGLSIVSGVVKRHGGEIEIESEQGVGSTVTITLPAAKEKLKPPSKKRAPAASSALRIMLVDDEAVLLEVLSELLGTGGHSVENFETGERALDAFRKNPFDLVITDRAMPNMSGDQLASEIKAINPDTPVIMATGFGEMIMDSEDAPSNVDLVLSKPVPLDVLNEKLLELTSQKLN